MKNNATLVFSTENCPSTYKRLGLTRYILFLTILVSDN